MSKVVSLSLAHPVLPQAAYLSLILLQAALQQFILISN